MESRSAASMITGFPASGPACSTEPRSPIGGPARTGLSVTPVRKTLSPRTSSSDDWHFGPDRLSITVGQLSVARSRVISMPGQGPARCTRE
eukprot:752303-Hanusia_phi.AAC.4